MTVAVRVIAVVLVIAVAPAGMILVLGEEVTVEVPVEVAIHETAGGIEEAMVVAMVVDLVVAAVGRMIHATVVAGRLHEEMILGVEDDCPKYFSVMMQVYVMQCRKTGLSACCSIAPTVPIR